MDFETFSRSDFRAVKVKACEAVKKSKKLLKFTLDDGSGEDRIILSGIHEYYEPEELVGKTCIAITNLPPRKMMGIDSCGMLISAVHTRRARRGCTCSWSTRASPPARSCTENINAAPQGAAFILARRFISPSARRCRLPLRL